MKKKLLMLICALCLCLPFFGLVGCDLFKKPEPSKSYSLIVCNQYDEVLKRYSVSENDNFSIDTIKIDGYRVDEVNTQPDFDGEILTGSIKLSADKKVYVKLTKLYKITFNGQNAVWGVVGDIVQMPNVTPTKTHARFLGWGKDGQVMLSANTTYTISAADFTNYTLNMTAIFEDALLVTFDSNGGSYIAPQYVFSGEQIAMPLCSGKIHYMFRGWKDGIGNSYDYNQKVTVTHSMTLTAQWSGLPYTLEFIHGSLFPNEEPLSMSVNYGEPVGTLVTPNYGEGFNFSGWYLDSALTKPVTPTTIFDTTNFKFDDQTSLNMKTKVYAKVVEETNIKAYGTGTELDPYRIYNASQFKTFENLSNNYVDYSHLFSNGENYKLMKDIVVPNDYHAFVGGGQKVVNLDGNNKTLSFPRTVFYNFAGTIKNLNLKYSSAYFNEGSDLSNTLGAAFIINLYGNLQNVNVMEQDILLNYASSNYTGDYMLTIINYGRIEDCKIDASIEIKGSKSSVGFHLFSGTNKGTIIGCEFTGEFKNKLQSLSISTIFSDTNEGIITECISSGEIDIWGGSIFANSLGNGTSSTITNCEVYGTIKVANTQCFALFAMINNESSASKLIIKDCKYSSTVASLPLLMIDSTRNSDINSIKALLNSASNVDTIVMV